MKNICRIILIILINLFLLDTSFAKAKHIPEIEEIARYYQNLTNDNRKKIHKIISAHKDDLAFQYELGKLYLKIHKAINAEQIFKKLYSIQPKDKYEISYGISLLRQKKFDEVLQIVDKKSAIKEYAGYKIYLHAQAHYGLNDYERALEYLDEAISLYPENIKFKPFKAQIYTSMGQPEKSIEVLKGIKKNKKRPISINTITAENYILSGDYLKAREIYNKIILTNKNNFDAYAGRARVNLLMHNNTEALKDGIIMFKKNKNHAMSKYVIAKAFLQKGKYKVAYKGYNGVSEKYKNFHEGTLLEAEIQLYNGHNEKAHLLLNKYIKNTSHSAKTYNMLGILKLRVNNYYDAINFFKKANSINKFDAYSITALAYAYYKLNQYKNSEFFYNLLKKRFPEYAYVSQDSYKLACNLKITKKLYPQRCQDIVSSEIAHQIFDALGQLNIGNIEEAYQNITQLAEAYPDNMLIKRYHARILNFSNKPDQAVNLLLDMLNSKDKLRKDDIVSILQELNSIYLLGKSSIDILNKLHALFLDNPNNINLGYHLANFFYKKGNYFQAVNVMKTMLKENPKDRNLVNIVFKIMIKDPDLFSNDIQTLLVKFRNASDKNAELITILRKQLIENNIKNTLFSDLKQSYNEQTPEEYQVYGEYHAFLNNHKKAYHIYLKAVKKFASDFTLYNKAFDYFTDQNDIKTLNKLINQFKSNDKNQTIILQAKLLNASHKKSEAINLLVNQFKEDFNNLIAHELLNLSPDKKIVNIIGNNIDKIKNNKFDVALRLAEISNMHYNYELSAKILSPYYKDKLNNIKYKFLVTQTAFYLDFAVGYQFLQDLIQKDPDNKEYLNLLVRYESYSKNYKQAILAFNNLKLLIKDNPTTYFYYAYALYQTNKYEEAEKILSQLLKSNIEFIEKSFAQKTLDNINKSNK